MAISAEEFGRRIDEKPLVTKRDLERYLRFGDDLTYVKVRGDYIPLLPRAADVSLRNDQLLTADQLAPFWRDDRPDCVAVKDAFSLREHQTQVRHQLGRRTCVAFASLAALEHLLRPDDLDINLSEQYANWLFMKLEDGGCREWLHTKRAAEYLGMYGVCREAEWGYKDAISTKCKAAPPKWALDSARFGIGSYKLIGGGADGPRMGNTDYLECVLAHGKTVVTALGLAVGEERSPDRGYEIINERPGVPLKSEGGHAMLLVGYDKNRRLFEFKNSWGTADDDDGYAWLEYDYVSYYARYGFIVMDVDSEKPSGSKLNNQDLKFVNLQLASMERRAYRSPSGSTVLIALPSIERTEATSGVVFKVNRVGDGLDEVEGGIISTEKFVLPELIEAKAGKNGIGQLVFTAWDEKGRSIPGVAPFVITVNVSNGSSDR